MHTDSPTNAISETDRIFRHHQVGDRGSPEWKIVAITWATNIVAEKSRHRFARPTSNTYAMAVGPAQARINADVVTQPPNSFSVSARWSKICDDISADTPSNLLNTSKMQVCWMQRVGMSR